MMEERFIRYCVDLILLPHDAIVRQREGCGSERGVGASKKTKKLWIKLI